MCRWGLVCLVIRVGIAGLSEGNGHPFSFAAIINGYSDTKFAEAGWPVILKYLRSAPSGQDGIPGAQVTHAWTQDANMTEMLCSATKIENRSQNLIDMVEEIDALIIARDDWEEHYEMAKPFLDKGIPVFIDKPLTLSESELNYFLPFIESGKLMSCSGFRYASELKNSDEIQLEIGEIKLISGTVVKDLVKYGIHMLEAISHFEGTLGETIIATRNFSNHESFSFKFDSGITFNLDCIGEVSKVFHLSVYGEKSTQHFDLVDNFSAFKSTLERFFGMVTTGEPAFNPQETVQLMRLLMASQNLAKGESAYLDLGHSKILAGG